MKLFHKLIISILLLGYTATNWAQTVADSLVLPEIVITERGNDKEIRSTSPMQIMSGKNIQNIQALNLSDAVKHFSGVTIKDYGGIGGLKTISVRSLGANHTSVNYNGVAISDVQSGQIDIGRFSLENVETISLFSGQSDQIFVSARELSTASALNIISSKPKFENGEKINGKASIKGGSFGLINPALNINYKLSNKILLNANGEWLSSNGEYPYRLHYGIEGVDSSSVERRENSDVQNIRIEGALMANISKETEANLRLYYYNSERGLPGATIYYNTENYSKQRLWDETMFAQGNIEHSFSRKWVAKLTGKYNHGYLRYLDPTYLGSTGKIEDVFTQSEMYGSFSILYRAFNSLSFSASSDLSTATMHSNRQSFATPTRLLSQSALAAKWVNEYAIATASMVYMQNKESVKNGVPSDNKTNLSPHASISIKPFDKSNFRVRAFYKNSFRLPTFNDLYYPSVGSRVLKPEDASQYNIGLTHSTSINGLMPLLKFTLDAYHNRIKNKIVAYPTSNLHQWAMMNFGKVEINGLDTNIEAAIKIHNEMNLMFSSSYTYQSARDKSDSKKSTYNNQLPYTPTHSGSARALIETSWLDVAYSLLWSGKRYYNAYNSPQYQLGGYYDHGITISKDIKSSFGDILMSIEGLNLINKNYQIVNNYPMPGRSYRASVKLKF